MKKIAGLIFSLLCVLLISFTATAGSCDIYYGSNENAQNYSVWASTVKSYLHVCSDGKLMRVQYLVSENKLLVEYYDSTFNLLSSKTVIPEFPVFGGFYAAEDYYFVLTGQNNLSESPSVTCFAVTKYDKDWNKIAAVELKNCNTTIPFDAGSARFCHSDKYLLIRTSHEMYKDPEDGYNHQANVTIQLDMNTMKITDYFTDVASVNYGYVSHSFNQFIKVDSDRIVALDHGDAYPRSIVLTKYKTSVSSGTFTPVYYQPCSTVDMLSISGSIGANRTDCSAGGFEVTSSGYLAAMNSIKQGSNSTVRNIYLSYCDKNSASPELKQITYYTSAGVSTPQLVKISENRFILLWCFDGKVHYSEIDGKGNVKGNIMSLEGALSDCQPVVYSGRLVWYVWKNGEVAFYSISLSDLSSSDSSTYVFGHNYSPVGVNGTSVSLRCSKCGAMTAGKVPSVFSLWWEDLSLSAGGYTYYSSEIASSYHPGETVGLMVKYDPADLNNYEVISADESVAKIVFGDGEYAVKAIGEGAAKVTVRSKYNHDVKKTYTFKVSHKWAEKENAEATCEKAGKQTKVCSVCGESVTETVAAKGHQMSSYKVTKEATCKAAGKKTSTCSVCGYTDSAEIPRKDHDSKVTIEGADATCTKQGKTDGKKCSGCGTVTVSQETIPALGHNLGEYKITKKPTCTAKGEETAKCTRCTYTKTRDVERVAHAEVTVKAVAPTCTKSGKTEGKKCSVCDKVTVEQETVEALGHNLGEYKITKKPTCTAKGEETAKCTRCTYTKTRDVERLAHAEVTVKAVAPTCTKSGKTEGKKCSVCDKNIISQETIKALGHKKKVTIFATATVQANGSISTVCERCGEDFGEQRVYRISSVSLSSVKCTYNGKTKTPSVRVVDYNKDTLIKDEDYTVTYSEGRKDIGEYYVQISFIGKYSGSEKLSFEILPGKTSKITATQSTSVIKLKWSAVKGANGYRVYQYNSKTAEYKQIASVKNTTEYRVTKLKAGTAYKFAVKAYYKDENGKVYFSTDKKAIATATEPAVPTVSLKVSSKTAVISWDKCTGADGYQVYYSTSKNGKYKKLKSTSALSFKKTGLTSGKKYYFKVRSYKKTSSATIYGEFSNAKSVKIK